MKDDRWVQHISGSGERWRVSNEYADSWKVFKLTQGYMDFHHLPKIEYVLCPPPEKWVDVTEACHINEENSIKHGEMFTMFSDGYRRRKVIVHRDGFPTSAIIIEKKVS